MTFPDTVAEQRFADRVTALEGDLIDTQGKLRALERRFEDFVLGRFSPPDPAANVTHGIVGIASVTTPTVKLRSC